VLARKPNLTRNSYGRLLNVILGHSFSNQLQAGNIA